MTWKKLHVLMHHFFMYLNLVGTFAITCWSLIDNRSAHGLNLFNYTVMRKIGTLLYFCNNFFKCWSIWMKITSLYSLGNLLSGDVVCNCIFHKYISRSTRITSHFSRTEPQRIGLAKLSNSWKSRRQTSFHQIWSQPSGLQDLGHTARTGLQDK